MFRLDPISDVIGGAAGAIGDAVNGAAGAISYWSDPWGNTFKALQGTAKGFSKDLLPSLTRATLPDLTADWFLKAYQLSFTVAILVAIILLFPQFIRTARGQQSGRDLVDSVGVYFGLFLIGSMFGPAIGIVLVNFFHALSTQVLAFGIVTGDNSAMDQWQRIIDTADPATISGGVVMAVVYMVGQVAALFMMLLVQIVQLVVLYFSGVIFPLGLVWILDKNKRQFGWKIAGVWIGVLASHPLAFFLLGCALNLVAASAGAFGTDVSLKNTVLLVTSIIAIGVACLSPLLLGKMANIIPPDVAGGAPNVTSQSSQIGPSNMADAGQRFGNSLSDKSSSQSSTSNNSDTSSTSSTNTGTGGGLADASASRAATAGAGEGAGAGATASAAGGGAGAAAGAAGAEAATGVGIPLAAATAVAAAGMAAADKGKQFIENASDDVAGHA